MSSHARSCNLQCQAAVNPLQSRFPAFSMDPATRRGAGHARPSTTINPTDNAPLERRTDSRIRAIHQLLKRLGQHSPDPTFPYHIPA
ncbi:MAG: hypothetical protein KF861_17120 [Planctomycetaceae bacterium]|nr:hypothetical protein [Planctomycetaceae bacterium]